MHTPNTSSRQPIVQKNSLPLPPGSFGLPLIGETISFLREKDFSGKRQRQYGSIFKTHLFGSPTIVMIGGEANQLLFGNENRYFSISWPYSTRVLLGPASLAVQTGSVHQKRRKLLFQAFQPRALAGYVSTMADITRGYLHKWEQMGSLTWYPELRKYTFDVACKLLIGADAAASSRLSEWFEGYVDGLFSIPVSLPRTKFSRALRCRELLLTKIEQIVQQRQQQPDTDGDALGILLQARDEDGNKLSLSELKDQVLLLLFAGHETLTSAIASFCLLAAQQKSVLQKARVEQKQLGLTEPLTLEHLKQMTYLEQVLKEVLRVIPPIGGGFRKVIQPCEFNGYLIPQDWTVLYQVGKTHLDSYIYADPERFNPQRFASESSREKVKPFNYIPFGGGVRECIGKEFARLEMKLFAALLIREYDWELVPGQNLDMVMMPTPRTRDGLRVKFQRLPV